jgi:hypothetical protein
MATQSPDVIRIRNFEDELTTAVELLCDKLNDRDWRGVARVASGISQTAKLREQQAGDWNPDDVVTITDEGAELLNHQDTEARR